MKKLIWALPLMGSVMLSGCGTTTLPLYQWEGYQPQVYEYFKGKSTEEQLTVLEADLQKIQAKGSVPPPGYHAHMGMLYASLGKDDQMLQEFQTEKKLFPESTIYMDFLMRKYQTLENKDAK